MSASPFLFLYVPVHDATSVVALEAVSVRCLGSLRTLGVTWNVSAPCQRYRKVLLRSRHQCRRRPMRRRGPAGSGQQHAYVTAVDENVGKLLATLDELSVPAKEKSEVLTAVSALKKDIVEKP